MGEIKFLLNTNSMCVLAEVLIISSFINIVSHFSYFIVLICVLYGLRIIGIGIACRSIVILEQTSLVLYERILVYTAICFKRGAFLPSPLVVLSMCHILIYQLYFLQCGSSEVFNHNTSQRKCQKLEKDVVQILLFFFTKIGGKSTVELKLKPVKIISKHEVFLTPWSRH